MDKVVLLVDYSEDLMKKLPPHVIASRVQTQEGDDPVDLVDRAATAVVNLFKEYVEAGIT